MAKEGGSIWQLYESSETVLWKRGRIVLVALGAFYFLIQLLLFVGELMAGNVERLLVLGVNATLFWLLFYLVWIGIHWIRWIWGGLNLIAGFFLLIWAWRDQSGFETLLATVGLLVGSYLCLAPSVYFFAKHQREIIRWKEALVFGGVGLLVLLSIAAGMLGLLGYRMQQWRAARAFAVEASERVFVDHHFDWLSTHVTQHSLQQNGAERLKDFLAQTNQQLGKVDSIQAGDGMVHLRFLFPATFGGEAVFSCYAETEAGPVELRFLLLDLGQGWQIEHMTWQYRPRAKPAN